MSKVARRNFIVLFIVPVSLVLVAYGVTVLPYVKYTRGIYELLVFLLVADLAVALPGRWRDATVCIASLIFGLAAIELISAFLSHNISTDTRGFSVARAELGWGPAAPGVYRGFKKNADGSTIYDVNYTIDRDLLRSHFVGPKRTDGRPSSATR